VGFTDPRVFHGRRLPVSGIVGDQQAALFGQACISPGTSKNTYGTGFFVLVNVGEAPADPGHGLLSTVAWRL
jgi:glycerol kinase